MTPRNRRDAMARNVKANADLMAQHQQVFDGLVAAGFRLVKVNAPLWEKQPSGQWACVGCSCDKDDCASIGKHPIGNGWQKYSTDDWNIARQWLSEGYNLGVFTPPTIRALGIDADREDVLPAMFPDGVPVTMGDSIGGLDHLFFTVPDGIDLDTIPPYFDGGEVSVDGSRHLVAPLSLHPRGRRKWNGITDIPPIPASALTWLQENKRKADEKHDRATGPADDGWKVKQGGRHPWLASQAGKLRNILASHDTLLAALRNLNTERCDPPIADADVVRLAKDFWKKEGGSPPGPTLTIGKEPRLVLATRPLGSYAMRPVEWLWYGWLAMEEPTLIDGMSGLGKSTFAMDVIARLTVGRRMPDGSPHPTSEPMRVLYISREDDPERVLLPRAIAAGADISMISFATGEFTMPEDAQLLLDTIRSSPDIGLVFIDPLFSHIGTTKDGKFLNPNSDVEMRTQVMEPLRDVCRATGVSILMARHLNKGTGMDIHLRGSGSYGGLSGAARGVILVANDPKDEKKRLKVVGPLKQQYSAIPEALRFVTWGTTVEDEDDVEYETSSVNWHGSVGESIETYLLSAEAAPSGKQQTRRDELDDLITESLEGGCVKSAEFEGAMLRAGYGNEAIKNARKRVGVVAHQHGPQDWHVRLSDVDCDKVKGAKVIARAREAPHEDPPDPSDPPEARPTSKVCECGAEMGPAGCSNPERHVEWEEERDFARTP